MSCRSLAAATALAIAVAAPPIAAAPYDFVVLADSAVLGVTLPAVAPSIDDDGAVAFQSSASGTKRIHVALGPGALALADYHEIAVSAAGMSPGAIGSFVNGRMAFLNDSGGVSIYRGGDGPPVLVTALPGAGEAPPPMNALGEVAILRSGSPTAIVVTDGADTTVIAENGQTFGDGKRIDNMLRPAPDIDGVGRVAYFASIAALDGPICDDQILLSGLVTPIEIATGGVLRNDCSFRLLDVTTPIALNDTGSAAFAGNFSTLTGSADAVFVDGSVVWEDRIGGFTSNSFIDEVAINDANTVAFVLDGAAGRQLYTGNDPLDDRVLGKGDTLCGQTVSDLRFHRFGLDDTDAMAIWVSLGARQLVVRAEPSLGLGGQCITLPVPEPASALAGIAALGALAAARRAPHGRHRSRRVSNRHRADSSAG